MSSRVGKLIFQILFLIYVIICSIQVLYVDCITFGSSTLAVFSDRTTTTRRSSVVFEAMLLPWLLGGHPLLDRDAPFLVEDHLVDRLRCKTFVEGNFFHRSLCVYQYMILSFVTLRVHVVSSVLESQSLPFHVGSPEIRYTGKGMYLQLSNESLGAFCCLPESQLLVLLWVFGFIPLFGYFKLLHICRNSPK